MDNVTKVRMDHPFSTLSSLYLANTVLGCDLLVSLPKMKTHHWAGATLSMKNLFGVVPGGHLRMAKECIALGGNR